ncbi:hypothetical protein PoB_002915300 [Plakobranchus ocellatus]|uniref:Uncharacterized protein n=1 Tax=Plakobranchus ocellatus TaxID=259542 RepID=A0AAV4A623_9GAST|nr:hypothetical protein PoB_002915300 [Plakobranchus ocellatus]
MTRATRVAEVKSETGALHVAQEQAASSAASVADVKSETAAVHVAQEQVASPATTSPQQGDLRLLGPPSVQGADGGARTRDRRVHADLRMDSLATVPPPPP